jgi:hypothetical protein
VPACLPADAEALDFPLCVTYHLLDFGGLCSCACWTTRRTSHMRCATGQAPPLCAEPLLPLSFLACVTQAAVPTCRCSCCVPATNFNISSPGCSTGTRSWTSAGSWQGPAHLPCTPTSLSAPHPRQQQQAATTPQHPYRFEKLASSTPHCRAYDISLSIGDGLRPGCIHGECGSCLNSTRRRPVLAGSRRKSYSTPGYAGCIQCLQPCSMYDRHACHISLSLTQLCCAPPAVSLPSAQTPTTRRSLLSWRRRAS